MIKAWDMAFFGWWSSINANQYGGYRIMIPSRNGLMNNPMIRRIPDDNRNQPNHLSTSFTGSFGPPIQVSSVSSRSLSILVLICMFAFDGASIYHGSSIPLSYLPSPYFTLHALCSTPLQSYQLLIRLRGTSLSTLRHSFLPHPKYPDFVKVKTKTVHYLNWTAAAMNWQLWIDPLVHFTSILSLYVNISTYPI